MGGHRWGGVAALALALAAALAGGTGPVPAAAQEPETGALLLVMDASGSMNATDDTGTPLIDGAKAALNRVVEELPDDIPVGLRIYGHRTPNTDPIAGCQDTELVVPVAPLDRARLQAAIAGYSASGYTPIGLSLQQAAQDLPAEGPRTIVLVSDGEDTCAPPDPCQVARDLVAQGVDVRIDTVGFYLQGNPAATEQLTCIAEATGGEFRTADNAAELAERMTVVSARAAREFSAEGTPVEGGPAAVDAPVLEPGTYTDTILALESSWYAVELEEGEELVATITRAGLPGVNAANAYMEVFFADPDLEEANIGYYGYAREIGEISVAQTVRIRTGVVGVDGSPPANSPSDPLRPGTYAIRVLQEAGTGPDNYTGREIPVELTFDVEQVATASPSPSPSASPSASPSPTPASEAATPEPSPSASATESGAGGGGISTSTVIIGLLSVLVVLMAVAVAVLLRRGRAGNVPPPPG